MTRNESSMRPGLRNGFSLVEVVIALALLGAVLISLSGLFVIGARQVRSGRDHSVALSVARDIQEEMNGWSFHWQHDAYGVDASQTTATVDSRDPGYASTWQTLLDRELAGAHAVIELTSVSDGGTPPALQDAQAIRVRVTVFWEEGLRTRSASLVAVRL